MLMGVNTNDSVTIDLPVIVKVGLIDRTVSLELINFIGLLVKNVF